jgi:hypothetical protein
MVPKTIKKQYSVLIVYGLIIVSNKVIVFLEYFDIKINIY